MDALHELTVIIEDLNRAGSFKEAAQRLTGWARDFTGCEAAILRLRGESEGGPWLAVCALDGPSTSFVRDETMVGETDCICGRVATGAVDPALPFYTEGGSFHWGRMGSFAGDFTPEQVGPLRGRCLEEGYSSLAVFPLRAGDAMVGSLHLADSRPDRFAGSVEVVESACRLAGDILLRHEASERERALLEAVQSALLPPVPPSVGGLSIGVSFESATDMARLGGDFYDVLDLGDPGVLVLVGDASGNGVKAAATAAKARYALEAHASRSSDPASFMGMTNESLLRLLPPEEYVTAVACLVDRRSRSVTTCLAGHPSPLHLQVEEGAGDLGPRSGVPGGEPDLPGTEIDAPPNAPLGLFPGLSYQEKTEGLAHGDVLLLYTDGVTDSRRGSAPFGPDGVARIVGSLADDAGRTSADPDHIARTVRSAASGYHDPSLPGDDRLVLAIRLDGAGGAEDPESSHGGDRGGDRREEA